MIGTNADIEKKADEISAQDVEIISAPKIVTVESMPFLVIDQYSVALVWSVTAITSM